MKALQLFLFKASVFLLVLYSLSLSAEEPNKLNRFGVDNCLENAMTQRDINLCFRKEFETVSETLSLIEKRIRSELKGSQLEAFAKAQQNWEAMVEFDCAVEREFYESGSIAPTIDYSCRSNRLNSRIEQIQYYLCPSWYITGVCE